MAERTIALSGLQKNSRTFQDPRNVFLGLCRSPAMFKYRDKQQLLTLYI